MSRELLSCVRKKKYWSFLWSPAIVTICTGPSNAHCESRGCSIWLPRTLQHVSVDACLQPPSGLQTPSNNTNPTTTLILLPILVQKEAESPSTQTGLLQDDWGLPFDETIRNETHALHLTDIWHLTFLLHLGLWTMSSLRSPSEKYKCKLALKKVNNHSNILVQPNTIRNN